MRWLLTSPVTVPHKNLPGGEESGDVPGAQSRSMHSYPTLPTQGLDVAKSSAAGTLAGVFASLEREWKTVASAVGARRASRVWARAAPKLDGFASPVELVAAIGRPGDSIRSCALLAELLVIADGDLLAARAVLQAIVPGLRRAARRRWHPTTAGPWSSANDVAADAVSAGWAAITVHAGQRHDRPAAVIVRAVEGRLRRTYDAWRRQTARTTALPANADGLSHTGLDVLAARTVEEQLVVLIAEARQAGTLDSAGARLLFATGVLGYTVAEVGRMTGIDGDAVYRRLHKARASMKSWVEDRSDLVAPRAAAEQQFPSGRPGPFPTFDESPAAGCDYVGPDSSSVAPLLLTPLEAAGLLRISRSTMYALLKAGEIKSVTVGASRRVPHRDLVDYVEQRRREAGSRRTSSR
jgi:excisionase family DNA binding protein